MKQRVLLGLLAGAVATGGVLVLTQPAQAANPDNHPTSYALFASGYASRVAGGSIPVGSGATAFSIVGCTDMSGLSKTNTQATIDLDGLGTISAADTHTWTTGRQGVVSANGSETIADVTLLDLGAGALSLDGITSSARVSHSNGAFHATTKASLGDISLNVLGVVTHFPVPPPGETVTIPGVAKVTLGVGVRHRRQHFSNAAINAVTVEVIPTGSTLYLGHTEASINDGIQSAVFLGGSFGTRLELAGGVVRVGKTPNLVMPCQGTDGITKERDIASVDLGALGEVDGLSTSQSSQQDATSASGWERGQVASVSLAGGSLVITGVAGQANAAYTVGGTVHKNVHGTTVATVMYNGEQLNFPPNGPLEIPGVASLQPKVVSRTRHSIEVIALRVTLLDGSGATLDLGRAKVGIHPSGL